MSQPYLMTGPGFERGAADAEKPGMVCPVDPAARAEYLYKMAWAVLSGSDDIDDDTADISGNDACDIASWFAGYVAGFLSRVMEPPKC